MAKIIISQDESFRVADLVVLTKPQCQWEGYSSPREAFEASYSRFLANFGEDSRSLWEDANFIVKGYFSLKGKDVWNRHVKNRYNYCQSPDDADSITSWRNDAMKRGARAVSHGRLKFDDVMPLVLPSQLELLGIEITHYHWDYLNGVPIDRPQILSIKDFVQMMDSEKSSEKWSHKYDAYQNGLNLAEQRDADFALVDPDFELGKITRAQVQLFRRKRD